MAAPKSESGRADAASRTEPAGPPPGVRGRAGRTWRRGLLPLALGLLCFFGLDRLAEVGVPPAYRSIPDGRRYHTLYFSQKLLRLERVRDRVEAVVLGDSRARHGVAPDAMGPAAPVTFNLAPASSGVRFTDRIVREYLGDLPRLRAVVWGVSPRIFNRYWADPVLERFTASPGYRHDRLRRRCGWTRAGLGAGVRVGFSDLLSRLSRTYAHRGILKARVLDLFTPADAPRHFQPEPPLAMDAWGFMPFPEAKRVDVSDPARQAEFLAALAGGRFRLEEARWRTFRELARDLDRRGVALVCFIPPMHPCLRAGPAADADATPRAAYADLVRRLAALEGEFANFHFLDLHRAGEHDFTDADFADFDHLNAAGAARLSARLGEALRTMKPHRVLGASPPPGEASPEGETPARPAPAPTPPAAADTTAPVITSMLGDMDYSVRAYPPDNRPLLWAEYRDEGSGIDVRTVRFFLNDTEVTDRCTITARRVSYRPPRTLPAPKLYRFKVVVADRAGNRAELVWEILLKPC